MTKQQTLDLLKSQLPGFYSAEQVIEMISKIEEPPSTSFNITPQQIDELVCRLTQEITDLGLDAVDDYELSMDGKEVQLYSLNFNSYSITTTVDSVVDDWIEEFFFKKEDEKEN